MVKMALNHAIMVALNEEQRVAIKVLRDQDININDIAVHVGCSR